MAAGTIITVASAIPWKQVIDAAPKVADAAVKLWNTITSRNKPESVADRLTLAIESAGLNEMDTLKEQIGFLDLRVNSLQEQIQASTGLIKTLAEQNAMLVQRIELNRIRLNRQLIVIAGGAAIMVVAIVFLFSRQ